MNDAVAVRDSVAMAHEQKQSLAIGSALALDEAKLMSVLESSVYPGAKRESIAAVINYCVAQRLDPILKPVHIVPMSVKKAGSDDYEWRDVIMPGIGLYRILAVRTHEWAGIDEGSFGPEIEVELGGVKVRFPEWCSVNVYRMVQGVRVAFSSGKVYWMETYATASRKTEAPNAMWKKRPRGQIEKCSEALALRRAFPEVGAQPTAEEMEGKVIDAGTGEIITGASEGGEQARPMRPQSRSGQAQLTHQEQQPATIEGVGTVTQETDDDRVAASEGMIKHMRARLKNANKDEAEALKRVGLNTFDGINVGAVNRILKWTAGESA